MARRPIPMTRGRMLLLALLQRTKAMDVAARCRVYPQRITDWVNGYRMPSMASRQALERNYGLPVTAWNNTRDI